jgi:short-subunit dehydrogenase
MKLKWKEPVVVITGASSGIGKATALRFAEEGARLVLCARRKKLLDELADDCEELGSRAIAVEADVTSRDDVANIARQAVKKFGRIDIWINDTGVATIGRFDEVRMEENEQVIRTNLLGVMYGSREALQHFRKRKRGVLINIASMLGSHPAPYQASYVASKHAVRGFSAALRQELEVNKENNIYVCTVMPVSINTPFFRHAARHTGKKVQPIPLVYPVQRVADTIYELAQQPRDEAIVGSSGKVLEAEHRLARGLTERMAARMTHRKQVEQAPPDKESSGSLFEPSDEEGGISDEWTESGKYVDAGTIALAAAVPIGVGLWLWRRRARANEPEIDRAA